MILNTFTKTKTAFHPLSANRIGWYICGPTVYDSAHMGHARNYVNFDVLRRAMQDYFGYNVRFVMNVTDIDDKIILRAQKRRAEFVRSRVLRFCEKRDGNEDELKNLATEVEKAIETNAPLKESPAPTVSTTSVFRAPALKIMIAKPSTAQAAAPCSPQAHVIIFCVWPRLQKSEAFLAKNLTGSR